MTALEVLKSEAARAGSHRKLAKVLNTSASDICYAIRGEKVPDKIIRKLQERGLYDPSNSSITVHG